MNDLIQRFYGSVTSLRQVSELAKKCKDLPGDFVECGIAMGSGIAAMKRACPEKRVWGYDSFQGIHLCGPQDTEQPGQAAIFHDVNVPQEELMVSSGVTVHPIEQVREILGLVGFKEEDFLLVEGWVQDTLPVMKPKKIAFLRLDMDLYDPTIVALTHLWPRMSKGAVLLVDDLNLTGVVRACDNYFLTEVKWNRIEGENPGWIVKN